MAIEIVEFPVENGGSFHSYVKLPLRIHQGMHHNHDLPPPKPPAPGPAATPLPWQHC